MDLTDPPDAREAFARRMEIVCDELGLAAGHGRQTALANRFGVTPKAARKWLQGLGYPEMERAVEICEAAKVNVNWLLQGVPPMRGERIDPHTLLLAQAIESLPDSEQAAVLEFLRFELRRVPGWLAQEQLRTYEVEIDGLQRRRAMRLAGPRKTDPPGV